MLGLFLAAAPAFAYDDGDFQVWNTDTQELKAGEHAKMTLEEEFRWGGSAQDFYYQHYDLGYVHSLNRNVDLGINYCQIYEKKNGDFKEENQPHLNAVIKFAMHGFKFEDRNRFQFRHFDYAKDFWQYRNKFTVKFPWSFTKASLRPYLADEIYLDLNDGEFSRNRFFSGLAMNITGDIQAEVYYLLQSSKSSGRWTDANVLGTKLKWAF